MLLLLPLLLLQVDVLHGELSKLTRQKVLEDFRQGYLRLLLVNDVAARGLDLPAVSPSAYV
jgi:superfamily II DNA/RNA helicase